MNETAIAETVQPDCEQPERNRAGQFLPGNRTSKLGGRPAGTPNLSTEYRRRILESLLRKTDDEIDAIRDADPIAFMRLGAQLVPREVELQGEVDSSRFVTESMRSTIFWICSAFRVLPSALRPSRDTRISASCSRSSVSSDAVGMAGSMGPLALPLAAGDETDGLAS